jgi:signal transduction histidine kinase
VAAAAAAALAVHLFRLRQIHARFEGILEERNRVARELHDTIIQGCGGVSALLEASATLADADPAMKQELLECARTQIRGTIDEARRVVWDLRQSPAAEVSFPPLSPNWLSNSARNRTYRLHSVPPGSSGPWTTPSSTIW